MSGDRYVAIAPKLWPLDDWGNSQPPTITVFETEPAPHPTGIVNEHGVPLYRVRKTVPMGFCGRGRLVKGKSA